jgi:hypothetical protein
VDHDPLGLDERAAARAVHGLEQLNGLVAGVGAARVDRDAAGGEDALHLVAAARATEQLALRFDVHERGQLPVDERLDGRGILDELVADPDDGRDLLDRFV